jgi:hypothetical protein
VPSCGDLRSSEQYPDSRTGSRDNRQSAGTHSRDGAVPGSRDNGRSGGRSAEQTGVEVSNSMLRGDALQNTKSRRGSRRSRRPSAESDMDERGKESGLDSKLPRGASENGE